MVLLNIPLTFIMVFAVMLYCRKLFGIRFKHRSDEVAVAAFGALAITFVLSALSTLFQLYLLPDRPGPQRTAWQFVMRGYLGDCSLIAIAVMMVYLLRSQYREKMAEV